MSMSKRNGLSRGDARRNARLIRLRGIVRPDRAILAIDLADTKQVLALCDHDSRVLAWRTTWGALAHNPVLAARHAHLTTRDHNQLTTAQTRTALAAALLRWLWVVVTTRTPWQATIAAGQAVPAKEVTAPAA
jgi:hypothetical protein